MKNTEAKRREGKNRLLETKKTVRVVFIALLLDILAFTIILPLFPRLLQEYQEREKSEEVISNFKSDLKKKMKKGNAKKRNI